jgi:hypothetical protein
VIQYLLSLFQIELYSTAILLISYESGAVALGVDRRPTVLSVITFLRKDVGLEALGTLVVLIIAIFVTLILFLRYYRYITLVYV